MTGIHRLHHPEPVEGCIGCKVLSVSVAPSATPSRGDGARAAEINAKDKQLDLDRAAYKRLRRDGLQPNDVDGSAELEKRVIDQIELDYKIAIPPKDLPRVKEIQAEVAQAQWAAGPRANNG